MDSGRPTEVADSAQLVPLRRNRDFTLLWTGQATSMLGTQISSLAYPLLILAATGSAAQAGIVASVTLIGTLVFLLPAGVVADRHPRKRIMVTASLVQMIAGATVVPAVLTHHVFVIHLAVVGCVQGIASAFYLGASRGATRRIVARGQLPEAMAATQARDRAATMLGPPAGGALFDAGRSLPFAVDSVSFGAIALAAALIRKPLDPDQPPAREPLGRSLTKGMRFIAQQPFLRMFAVWTSLLNGVVFGIRLTIIVVARNRGATPFEIGTLFTISAGCGLAGALLAVRLSRLAGPRLLTLLSAWLFPACAAGMFFAPSVWVIAALAGVTGFAIMPVNVLMSARSAQITPHHLQAQTGNTLQLCYQGLASFTPAIFGALTDKIGAYPVILVAAVVYGALAIWLQFNRELHHLGDRLPDPGNEEEIPDRAGGNPQPATRRKGQAA
ncbi:MAG TPA: MFS transporter [Streptosporangiaceae bacterium]|nr:MFS transporter [Streptosporangiaceae bacterium]